MYVSYQKARWFPFTLPETESWNAPENLMVGRRRQFPFGGPQASWQVQTVSFQECFFLCHEYLWSTPHPRCHWEMNFLLGGSSPTKNSEASWWFSKPASWVGGGGRSNEYPTMAISYPKGPPIPKIQLPTLRCPHAHHQGEQWQVGDLKQFHTCCALDLLAKKLVLGKKKQHEIYVQKKCVFFHGDLPW